MSNRQLSNGPHFITTAPSLTTCIHCSQTMLAATVGGLDRHVDTATLTEVGELQALLAGRPTYDLAGERLIRRTVERIRDGDRAAVLAEHNCTPTPDEFIDGAHMTAAIWLVTNLLGAQPLPADDAPPF